MKTVAETLGVARSNLHDKVRQAAKPRASYRMVRRLIGERPTYGYRRITALANRELGRTGEPVINHKRMFRIMRQNGMLLAQHRPQERSPPRRQGGRHGLEPALVFRRV
jgi:putative transposase